MRKRVILILLVFIAGLLPSCRKGEFIIPSTPSQVTKGVYTKDAKGLFLLNEGNMGSNKATLDYFDYGTGIYNKNIYAERNPNVVKELGDVGNDIQIYRDNIFAVINCSNLVEVMDVNTAKHVAVISIPNCRYITFDGDYAYVSSYAGPVGIDPNARLGYVAKIDLNNFTVVDGCDVGYQPEEMVVIDNKLYVANSGGYRGGAGAPYDNRVSVIDLSTFEVITQIEVAINLHRMEKDNFGNIYVSSRGDHGGSTPSKTFIIDTNNGDAVSNKLNEPTPLANTNMVLSGDFIYLYSFNFATGIGSVTYAVIDTRTQKVVRTSFITDGTDKRIEKPYGLAVNPENGEIFVTDATNYVTPGTLYCFDAYGTKMWEVVTGDIPAHIVFTNKVLDDIK